MKTLRAEKLSFAQGHKEDEEKTLTMSVQQLYQDLTMTFPFT